MNPAAIAENFRQSCVGFEKVSPFALNMFSVTLLALEVSYHTAFPFIIGKDFRTSETISPAPTKEGNPVSNYRITP